MTDHQRIRIGNQTAYKAWPLTLPFEYAIDRGFDAFEWFPDRRPTGQGWDVRDLDITHRREIGRQATEHDIALSVHAPIGADPSRPESFTMLDDGLTLAKDLGASLLNIHFSRAVTGDNFAAAVTPLADRCAAIGFRLAIENTPADGPDDFNALFDRLHDQKTVGMCLDIGHANLHELFRNDYLGYVDRLGLHVPIIHVHAHENAGDRDSHWPLFSGPAAQDPSGIIGLMNRLRGRRFDGSIILEQWPDPPSLLDRARAGLLQLCDAHRR